MTQVYFTDIKSVLLKELNSATQSITLVVSWLTDKELFLLLIDKIKQGVIVNLITRNDYLNNHVNALDWNLFIRSGGKLYFSRDGEQIHYKYILIDNKKVVCTSYNLTCFANGNNRENILLIEDEEVVGKFIQEFEYLSSQLTLQSNVQHIIKEDVPAHLHGFYDSTIENDTKKQVV